MYQRLKWFFGRPDTQQNLFKAIFKHLIWRLRWVATKQLFIIPLGHNLKIAIPKSGSGASIYYRGFSEPETASFIQRFLRPGMVVIDVGAHVGEYTLIAAQIVGETGQVHAFEPQPHIFEILRHNVRLNGLNNVITSCLAVSDYEGELEFEVSTEPSMSSIRKHETLDNQTTLVKVNTSSLDAYLSKYLTKVDLIKVDVEGAEKFVFQGATELLRLPSAAAPTWIFEYAPRAYSDFNYKPDELLQLLKQYGYSIWQYDGVDQLIPFNPDTQLPDIVNLIANKDERFLLSLLQCEKALSKPSELYV